MALFEVIMDLNFVLVFIVIFLTTFYSWSVLSNNHCDNEPPGPTPWPIIGNIPALLGEKSTVDKLMELRDKYGNIVRLRLGLHLNVVFVFGHKLVYETLVLKGHLTKFRPNDLYFNKRLSEKTGIFMSSGEHWQHLRKFTAVTLKDLGVGKKSLEDRAYEEASIVCEILADCNGKPINLKTLLANATSNIIFGIIFGSRFDFNDPEFTKLLQHLTYFMKNVKLQLPENFFPFIEKLPFSKVRKIMENLDIIYSYIRSQIDKHRESYDRNCIRDMIDLYIENTENNSTNEHITEKSLFYTIRDLYTAGSETTATSLLWMILYLTKYPEVQKRCRAELINVVGYRSVTTKDRDELPFLVAFIYEIQRMVDIAPIAAVHSNLEDIEIGGKIVVKNSMIIPILGSVHRDKEYWENPDEFRPERFLNKNGKPVKPEAFYPFSNGPRTCLGKQLAEMQLFIFLATMLQRFEFKHADQDNIVMDGYNDGISFTPAPYLVYATERL